MAKYTLWPIKKQCSFMDGFLAVFHIECKHAFRSLNVVHCSIEAMTRNSSSLLSLVMQLEAFILAYFTSAVCYWMIRLLIV